MGTSALTKDQDRDQNPTRNREELDLPLPQLIVLTPAQTTKVGGGCSKCGRSAVLASDVIG